MNSISRNTTASDKYLSDMKTARHSSAVIKAKLATIKAANPNGKIFAFEGKDDKAIYYNWTRRVRDNLKYEPFPCNGKKYVIQLIKVINRDLNNIGENVYFFVDRDFDKNKDLLGAKNTYITSSYSIENYLVNSQVIDELLKNDLHCHDEPGLRSEIVSLFEKLYEQFLSETKEINYRVYFARTHSVSIDRQLPDKANQLAKISIDRVESSGIKPHEVVILNREPTREEDTSSRIDFETLDATSRYRGKFAIIFLKKWLQQLVDDRNKPRLERTIFKKCQGNTLANPITLDSLASKADMPECFVNFIKTV